jgi:hypothetical protein
MILFFDHANHFSKIAELSPDATICGACRFGYIPLVLRRNMAFPRCAATFEPLVLRVWKGIFRDRGS